MVKVLIDICIKCNKEKMGFYDGEGENVYYICDDCYKIEKEIQKKEKLRLLKEQMRNLKEQIKEV